MTTTTSASLGQSTAFAIELQRQVYQLNRILGLVDQHSVVAHGTTVAQTYTLLAFPAEGTLTMHELSVAMNLAGSTMTRVVDKLVAGGLAERAPDEEDGRIVRVSLTESGRELRAVMESIFRDLFAGVADKIDERDREPFLRALRQVVGALSEVADCC
jgi:DNA-binding MarR family transcriptional regulator